MRKTLSEIALSQCGQKEITGKVNNKTIVNYSIEAGHTWVSDDETPWCSIFMDWCAMKAGVERTHKANARSWLDIGDIIEEPEVGDIVIFQRGSNPAQGHVAIFCNYDINPYTGKKTGYIYVLGGNQSNQVKVALYKEADVLGYRRLKDVL